MIKFFHYNRTLLEEILGTMSTRADLDAAVAAIQTQAGQNATAIQAATQLIIDDCNALLAKVGQGQDFTAEVTSLQATATALQTAVTGNTAAVQAEDQIVNPPGSSDFPAPKV